MRIIHMKTSFPVNMADNEDTRLVKTLRSSSVEWNYFGLKTNKNGVIITSEADKPVCRTCYRSIPAKGGNTSNLMNHLKEHHVELYTEALSAQKENSSRQDSQLASSSQPPPDQSTITDAIEATKKFSAKSPDSPRTLELNKAVAYFIAKDE